MNSYTSGDIVLVGHPYAPIGRGEDVRCTFRALRSVGITPSILDIRQWGYHNTDAKTRFEFERFGTDKLGRLNIFLINGDEVRQTLGHLAPPPFAARNIIYPAWELSRYPEAWARELERFDEIWAPSQFIHEAITSAVSRPVFHMPLACECYLTAFHGRRYFGIPESSYVFCFFFDFLSYVSRKNPQGVIDAFEILLSKRPCADVCLVVKLNSSETSEDDAQVLRATLARLGNRAILIDRTLTDNEVKNLVRCSDCFVSLHRAEGFGRGPAEAMSLGKPVIGTAYSGNVDFMTAENSLLVTYSLVDVAPRAYPHWEGQQWAEPDIGIAATHMISLVDDPDFGRLIGRKASLTVRNKHGYLPVGNRYRERLDEIRLQLSASAIQDRGAAPCDPSANRRRRLPRNRTVPL